MSILELYDRKEFEKVKTFIQESQKLLERAVLDENVELIEFLLDNNFDYLPQDFKFPANSRLLKILKYKERNLNYRKACQEVDDLEIYPYYLVVTKDYKRIDHYFTSVARSRSYDNRVFEYGTLEMVNTYLESQREYDLKRVIAMNIRTASENERDSRIFAKCLSFMSLYAPNFYEISDICLEVYLKEYVRHSPVQAALVPGSVPLNLKNKQPWRFIQIFDEIEINQAAKRAHSQKYFAYRRLKRIVKKYGGIWLDKWTQKSG